MPPGSTSPTDVNCTPPAIDNDAPPTVDNNLPLTVGDTDLLPTIANNAPFSGPKPLVPATTLPAFFLRRQPLEYLLVRPSNQEFAQDRPRALWKLAPDHAPTVVQSQALSSRTLLGCHRVFKFVRSKQQHYMDSAKAQEWNKLVQGIHPNNIHLQYCIKMLQRWCECINPCVIWHVS